MGIVDRVANELKRRSMSMRSLEKALGFGNATINKWDKSSPSVDKASAVANYLNVSLEYLISGQRCEENHFYTNIDCVQFTSTSQKIDYLNRILHLKQDTIFTRFKEARAAAGVTLEDAAKGAFLKPEQLQLLENDDTASKDVDAVLEQLREIGWEQYAYLAFRYNVDLYWLLCGKVRPPAAVVQSGRLVFPPYEFMMDNPETAQTGQANHPPVHLTPEETELLARYNSLDNPGKTCVMSEAIHQQQRMDAEKP